MINNWVKLKLASIIGPQVQNDVKLKINEKSCNCL